MGRGLLKVDGDWGVGLLGVDGGWGVCLHCMDDDCGVGLLQPRRWKNIVEFVCF